LIPEPDPLSRGLTGMTLDGWNKFSGPLVKQSFEAQLKQQREAVMRRANVVAQVFATDAGREVLDTLVREVLLHNQIRPTDERLTLEQQALYAARREGQNSVIAMLLNAVAMARGDQPTMKEGT